MTTCKLCQKSTSEVGLLQRSHVIPRFMIKQSKSRSGRHIKYERGQDSLALAQEDWKEPLLCSKCEQHIRKYEDLLSDILAQRRKKHPVIGTAAETAFNTDANILGLALLSILWRSAVGSHAAFQKIRELLPPANILEMLRNWLLSERVPLNWQFAFRIGIEEICNPDGSRLAALLEPFLRRTPGKIEYVFVCGGFLVTFAMPGTIELVTSNNAVLVPDSKPSGYQRSTTAIFARFG